MKCDATCTNDLLVCSRHYRRAAEADGYFKGVRDCADEHERLKKELTKVVDQRIEKLETLLRRCGLMLSQVPVGTVRGTFSILREITDAVGDDAEALTGLADEEPNP